MEQLIKVAEGYELVPSKAGIEAMVSDMMLKVDIVLGLADEDKHPEIAEVKLPEGFSVYSVAHLAAQSRMMEEFSALFKKEIAKRMLKVMAMFEGDPHMNKSGNSFTYEGVTFTKTSGRKVYDFTSSKEWKEQNEKVSKLKSKLKIAEITLTAIEDKMKEQGDGYVTDKASDSVKMSLGK